jgi:rhamnose utilization protein RhaD (predicted bifunctional aldolase and dehydrogenase)
MAFALQNRWARTDAGGSSELDDAIRAARLIGAEPELVLFGGGNTSVKVLQEGREVMFVKGSGADLAHVTANDYTPLALGPVRELLAAELPDNRAMYSALAPHVLRATAPRPSIETLMHAGMDAPHVIHTHAAAVLAIANTRHCARHLQAAFGPCVPVAPYRHSGAELARACVETWRLASALAPRAMVLAHHGALACGYSAGEAYDAMLDLANRAEDYLESHGAPHLIDTAHRSTTAALSAMDTLMSIARLRSAACRIAGRKLIGTRRGDAFITGFARRADVETLTSQGPSTPGHAIWTKRIPMMGSDIDAFAAAYRSYLAGAAAVDCAPRVVLDRALGMIALGVTKRHADMTARVFMHDAIIMTRAAALGGYATIGPDLLRAAELEYAGFEARVAAELPRAGEIHVIDRANDRIDAIQALLDAGAAVAGIERGGGDSRFFEHPAYLRVSADIDPADGRAAVIEAFGGIDRIDAAAHWQNAFQPFMDLDNA